MDASELRTMSPAGPTELFQAIGDWAAVGALPV
jgi:hypothetical protein